MNKTIFSKEEDWIFVHSAIQTLPAMLRQTSITNDKGEKFVEENC
jgi:hypothetical protein